MSVWARHITPFLHRSISEDRAPQARRVSGSCGGSDVAARVSFFVCEKMGQRI